MSSHKIWGVLRTGRWREEGRPEFRFTLKLHIELEGSLGFMRLGLKKKKKMAMWLHGLKHFGTHIVVGGN